MANVSENLQALLNAKSAIREALLRKNSEPTGGLTTYADAVDAINIGEAVSCSIEFPNDYMDIAVMMGGVDITDSIVSGGLGSIDSVTGDLVIKVAEKMRISYNLTSVLSSSSKVSVTKGSSYTTTLSFSEGYEWDSVSVLMGGQDITEDVFNSASGVVSIPSVSGDVVINASSKLKVFTITRTLSNTSISNSASSAQYGSSYTAVLSPAAHYTLGTTRITMGGQDITGTAYSNGSISISAVTGDVVIESTANIIVRNITATYVEVTSSNSDTTINDGASYTATLTPTEGYEISTVIVTMGGNPVSTSGSTISIPSVSGDIVINAVAVIKTFTITNTLSHISTSNTAGTINYGQSYNATLTPDTDYSLGTISVTMGGQPVSVSGGVISIAKVTGPIVINATGSRNTVGISSTLSHISLSNPASEVDFGTSYSATLTPDTYYEISSVSVMMGGVDVTGSVYSGGSITIPSVSGEVVITASATIKTATITYNFTSVNSTNSAASVNYGTSYTATLSSTKNNWSVNSIQVMMGGVDVTGSVVEGTVITIPTVTGDIAITATSSRAKDIGTVTTTNNIISINDGELSSGTYTMRYVDADGNPLSNVDDITTFTI